MMKLNALTLNKAIVLVLLALLALSLGACDKTDADADVAKNSGVKDSSPLSPTHQHYPTTAMTWDEWVAYDSPNRNGFEEYYHSGKGFPNISQWTPQDFLPADMVKQTHRNVCELPNFTRYLLRNAQMGVYEMLDLAEQGYAEAQSALGQFCNARRPQYFYESKDKGGDRVVLADDERPVSIRDALRWAQRGAASGNAIAQSRLAYCLYDIYLYKDKLPASEAKNPIELDAFWDDRMFYWREKALENALLEKPTEERSFNEWFSPAVGSDRRIIENYKWSRLWELQANFRRWLEYGTEFGRGINVGHYDSRSTADPLQRMNQAQIAQAEHEVGEWLRAHPLVWQRIYDHTYLQGGAGEELCPGEPGHRQSFDFARLKIELAPYGVTLNIPEK